MPKSPAKLETYLPYTGEDDDNSYPEHGMQSLYMYMSVDSLYKIMESKMLKLSRTSQTNDSTENLYAKENDLDSKAVEYGYLCFSATSSSPMMWGQYADRGKGVCLVFAGEFFQYPVSRFTEMKIMKYLDRFTGKMKDCQNDELSVMAIEYRNKRVTRAEASGIGEHYYKILMVKHSDWKHEKEYRYMLPLWNAIVRKNPKNAHSCSYYCDKFLPLLSKVILGVNCDLNPYDLEVQLMEVFKRRISDSSNAVGYEYYKHPIKVVKASLDSATFNITTKLSKPLDLLLPQDDNAHEGRNICVDLQEI